jgi:hypothetical protein
MPDPGQTDSPEELNVGTVNKDFRPFSLKMRLVWRRLGLV